MDLPTALSRRNALLLLVASALDPLRVAPAPRAEAPAYPSGEFVVINGWVLPSELFGRE